MKSFFARLRWKWMGSPTVTYHGYNCGCCGTWVDEDFAVPTYQSAGQWWDTWGVCKKCKHEGEKQLAFFRTSK